MLVLSSGCGGRVLTQFLAFGREVASYSFIYQATYSCFENRDLNWFVASYLSALSICLCAIVIGSLILIACRRAGPPISSNLSATKSNQKSTFEATVSHSPCLCKFEYKLIRANWFPCLYYRGFQRIQIQIWIKALRNAYLSLQAISNAPVWVNAFYLLNQ